MKRYVIDASVAIKCVMTETQTDAAEAFLPHILIAPDFLLVECANIIWKKYIGKIITLAETRECLQRVRSIPSELYASEELLDAALRLSIELNHPIYDCLYLALALQEDIPLVTADEKFYKTVRKHAKWKQAVELL